MTHKFLPPLASVSQNYPMSGVKPISYITSTLGIFPPTTPKSDPYPASKARPLLF